MISYVFLQELTVYAPPGNLVGTVVQQWAVCQPIFDINDDEGKTVLKLEGPICQCSMCGDVEFNVIQNHIISSLFFKGLFQLMAIRVIITGSVSK